jgi:hypothetical protein
MTVAELIRELQAMPGHWPVHVEVKPFDTSPDDTGYHYTLDVQRHNFPTQGNMAVIRLGLANG